MPVLAIADAVAAHACSTFSSTLLGQVRRFRRWNRDRLAGIEPDEWANFQDVDSDSDWE